MKKPLPFFALLLFIAAASPGANPAEPFKPPGFLKVGGRYALIFVNGSEPERVYGEIKEFGPGTWMQIESMAEPESADRRRIRVETPVPSASVLPAKDPVRLEIPPRKWCNLAKLAAVVLREEPGEAAPAPDAPSFPKVGIPYYLNAVGRPYFGKVMETAGDGWFRLHEKSPRGLDDKDRSVHWWINLSFLTQLTEAKPGDWPD